MAIRRGEEFSYCPKSLKTQPMYPVNLIGSFVLEDRPVAMHIFHKYAIKTDQNILIEKLNWMIFVRVIYRARWREEEGEAVGYPR